MYYQEFNIKNIQNLEQLWSEQTNQLVGLTRKRTYNLKTSIIIRNGLKIVNLSYLCIDKLITDGFWGQNAIIYDIN